MGLVPDTPGAATTASVGFSTSIGLGSGFPAFSSGVLVIVFVNVSASLCFVSVSVTVGIAVSSGLW